MLISPRALTHSTASTSSPCHSFIPRSTPIRSSPVARSSSEVTATAFPVPSELITFQEVQDVAQTRGIYIKLSTLGPGYRIICRDGSESGPILGVTTGFILQQPLGLMHCDALQIFTKGQRGEQGSRTRGGILGLGLLIGGATFAYGWEQGCKKAEILAINDDDAMHARLVRYYSRFGFKAVRVVTGGKLSDLPHMLVWGGAGTRMDADVQEMLRQWGPAIRGSRK